MRQKSTSCSISNFLPTFESINRECILSRIPRWLMKEKTWETKCYIFCRRIFKPFWKEIVPSFLKATTMLFWSGFFLYRQFGLENTIVTVSSSDFITLINMIIPYLLTQYGTPLQQTSINFLKFWMRIFLNWDINISWNWDVGISG